MCKLLDLLALLANSIAKASAIAGTFSTADNAVLTHGGVTAVLLKPNGTLAPKANGTISVL